MSPELRIFAGPNGSGKSTLTPAIGTIGKYINADDIARFSGCTVLEAAKLADGWRLNCIQTETSFTTETVLSTEGKLDLMQYARERGFIVKGVFVFTRDVHINIARVKARVAAGGHDVPRDKIISRYEGSLWNIQTFVKLCDVCHIIDNTNVPQRIYKKRMDKETFFENDFWSKDTVEFLLETGEIVER